MAKEPTTIDRFRVSCEVAKEQLGHIIAEFTKMGLAHVHYEMITDTVAFRKNNRTVHDTSGEVFLREWVKDHPTFKRTEVIQYFEASGRTMSGGSSALQRLRELGEVKSIGDGNYQRAGMKAIAPPKKEAKETAKAKVEAPKLNKKGKPLQRKPNTVTRFETTNVDFMLKKLRGRQKFTVKEMQDYFTINNRNPASVSPIVTKLQQTHKIRHIGAGEYALVKTAPKPPPPKLNGTTPAPEAPTDEAVTNG